MITESFIASASAAKEDQYFTQRRSTILQFQGDYFTCCVEANGVGHLSTVTLRFCACKVRYVSRIFDHEVKSQDKQNGRSCHTTVAMDTFLGGVVIFFG